MGALFEQLHVAEEELRQQVDELTTKRASLEAEHTRYTDLFEEAPDAYLVTDSFGSIREANRAAEWLFGLAREYLRGKPVVAFVADDDRRLVRQQQLELNSGQRGTGQCRVRVASRSGRVAWAAVRIERGAVAGATELRWLLRDVTDQIAAEVEIQQLAARLGKRVAELEAGIVEKDRLLAAEREAGRALEAENQTRTDFLAVLSHEFRTPLQAIYGYAELLDIEVHGPLTAGQREDVTRIRKGLAHLVALVTHVLDRARIDAGRVEIELSDVPLGEALELALTLVAPQVRSRGLRLETEAVPSGLCVRADGERLHQVMVNLLANAVKFTEPGGLVRLEVRPATTTVTVAIVDSGRGIPADKVATIFEPYVRLASGPIRSGEANAGLGLSITRDLVSLMGGRVTVESTVGVGSRFEVMLQRAENGRPDAT